jgi:formylglycine-generating enzyme required for sulfatase activity
MGSPSKEIGRYDDELLHKVTIKQGFTIWKTEITQAEYKQYVGGNPSHFEKCGDACPVENVTWHEALQMCNKMSQAQGLPECFTCELKTIVDNVTNNQQKLLVCTLKEQYVDSQGNPDPKTCWGYRLPTEAEWEFAARAGTQTATYKGELIDGSCGPDRELNLISWYCQNANSTQITGLKEPNKWGLYDMLGNVREWVWDFYAPYPNRPATDPIGPLTGSGRVVRGGSWSGRALESRAAYRYDHEPFRREYNLGCRGARNVPPPTTQT